MSLNCRFKFSKTIFSCWSYFFRSYKYFTREGKKNYMSVIKNKKKVKYVAILPILENNFRYLDTE